MKKITFITSFILLFVFTIQPTLISQPIVLKTNNYNININNPDKNPQSRIPSFSNNLITWIEFDETDIYIYVYEIGNPDQDPSSLNYIYTYPKAEGEEKLIYPPHTDGTFVVWSGKEVKEVDKEKVVDNDWDIFLWEKGTESSSIINISDPSGNDNNRNDFAPYVSNGKVVWFQGRINQSNSYHEIWIWENGAARQVNSTNDTANDCRPRLGGPDNDRIVRQKARGRGFPIGYRIMVDSTQITNTDSGNHINPVIDNFYVFWQAGDGINRIPIDNISSGNNELISVSGTTTNSNIHLCNTVAVWQAQVGGSFEIFMKQEDNPTIQITNNIYDDTYPHVYYDLTNPNYSKRIVWQGFDGNDTEIYLFANDRITLLTNNEKNDCRPQVWGDSVVWESYDNDTGFSQICLLEDTVGPYISVSCDHGFENDENLWANETYIDGNIEYGVLDGEGFWEFIRVLNEEKLDGDWQEFSNNFANFFDATNVDEENGEKYEGKIYVFVRHKETISDDQVNFSNVVKTQIRLDGTPPEILINDSSEEVTITKIPVTLNITAQDQDELSKMWYVNCFVQDGDKTIDSYFQEVGPGINSISLQPIEIALEKIISDNIDSIEIEAFDRANNRSQKTIPIYIDITGPTIETIELYDIGNNLINLKDGKYWTNSSIIYVNLEANDTQSGVNEQSWQYQFWSEYSSDDTYKNCISIEEYEHKFDNTDEYDNNDIPNDINYTAAFIVSDTLGNVSPNIATITFNIDRTSPYFLEVTGCEWSNEENDFVATAIGTDDFAGIESWYWYLGEEEPAIESDWNPVNSVDDRVEITDSFNSSENFYLQGENYIWFRAIDKAGNTATADTFVRKDQTLPALNIITTGWSNGTVSATAFDEHSGIKPDSWGWILDNREEVLESEIMDLPWNSPEVDPDNPGNATAFVSPSETQRIWFIVYDNAGNYALANRADIQFDLIHPTITWDTTNWSNGEAIPVLFADTGGSEINSGQCFWSLDGMEWQNCDINDDDGTTIINISPDVFDPEEDSGTQELDIWFSVKDNAGNTTEIQGVVKVDRTPPTITVTPQGNVEFGEWTGTSPVVINLTVVDDNPESGPCLKEVKIDNADFTRLEDDTIEITGIATVQFRGTDEYGNATTTELYEIKIDTRQPNPITYTFSGNVQPDEWTNDLPVEVTADAVDNDSGIDPESWKYSIMLPDNSVVQGSSHTLTLINEDLANEGINRITFRVSDNVQNTRDGSVLIKIDTVGPVITANVLPDTVIREDGEWIVIETLTIEDYESGLSDEVTWFYAFDNQDTYNDLPETIPFDSDGSFAGASDIYLSTLTLDEGNHRLYLKAIDSLENEGFADYGFYIDRTMSSITDILVQGLSSEEEYSQFAQVMIEVSVDDETRLTGFQYAIESFFTENPDFDTEMSLVNGNEPFWIILENEGINYLYIRAIEQGGLYGVHAVKIIRLDTGQPGIPNIEGLTHPRAQDILDAVPVKDAVFSVTPGSSSVSGIGGYRYELYKGPDPYCGGEVSGTSIAITNLEDNGEDEFYTLYVWVLGGNGRESSRASYQFRIDTQPPETLTIYVAPHSNPEYWYPASTVNLSWEKPQDMTGVKSYYYKLSEDETVLVDPDGWIATDGLKAEIDLETMLEPKYGEVFFAVRAEDYAENQQYDQGSLLFDVQKPGLEELPAMDNCINVTPDLYTRTAFVEWGAPYDEGSGVSRIEI